MSNSPKARYFINKIDSRLGSTEKELKFDKIAIVVGLLFAIVCAFLTFYFSERHPVLALFLGMLVIFGLCIAYTMVKEYVDDLKRYKSQNKN